ncbi:MAG: alpha-galactosidase [Clostridia bacterium]|nr:alpha-galactosidase [Clostridia bacterium]
MIDYSNKIFWLSTDKTSYVLMINERGHLENIHYGDRLEVQDVSALRQKNGVTLGSTVEYDREDYYSLDSALLEYSGIGKGDYRHSPIEIIMPDGSFVCDFVYESHKILEGSLPEDGELPFAYGDAERLEITLADKKYTDLKLKLNYVVYSESNVIARNVELINGTDGKVYIRKLMSLMLDLPSEEYDMITFDGSWAKEAHTHRRPVEYGALVNDSITGSSSNRHNAGFLLARRGADGERGRVYAFNLVYSGNHYSEVERAPFGTLRVMQGINPHCFLWRLSEGERFVTPQSVFSYSGEGINGVSANMHEFVNSNIVRGEHKGADRPIVINNWESTFFNFKRRKLLALAKKAKALGIEMFVLDDGWFGERNSDKAGLGDYNVNKSKLKGGISGLARRINKLGMKFGLWFEPESVNEDSDLYRAHPDYAIAVPGREPSLGRNQMVLDLTRKEVRDYIVESVSSVLESANIEYVKWDYNRHISDMFSQGLKNQGEFYHRYILGLYEILRRIFHERFPHILLESCSSGGNRFDLGVLCYSPQIWTSDNTDPIERLEIQGGIYTLYPQSTVSAHVSMAPHQQTLRDTPLSTRFNVAAFGVLGYELDFGELTPRERKEVKAQIAFYKAHRRTLQYGRLYRPCRDGRNKLSWQVLGDGEIIAGEFQHFFSSCPPRDRLRVPLASPDKQYTVDTKPQDLRIRRFGSLIKHLVPFDIKADGFLVRTVDRHFALTDGREHYTVRGDALNYGINLEMQYEGTGYSDKIRIYGDFGSGIYVISEKPEILAEKSPTRDAGENNR